jgi:hypothetical protein
VTNLNNTYKPNEFAKLIGVSVTTLQRWDNAGKLKAYRTPTNRRFYTHEQYTEYMKNGGMTTLANDTYQLTPMNLPAETVMKMKGTDALDTAVPVFTILTDMVRSLENSKYQRAFLIKGGFALMAAVKQHGKQEYIRGTTDIDLDFLSLAEWEKFVSEVSSILTDGSKIGAVYKLSKRRGVNNEFQNDALLFSVSLKGTPLPGAVGIDMNVKTLSEGVEYCIPELSFTGATVLSMLADKLSVLSTRTVLRRTKDLVDSYIISKVFNLSMSDIVARVESKGVKINAAPFILDGNNIDGKAGLKHSYTQQRVGEPLGLPFEEVYKSVLDFLTPIYQELLASANSGAAWDCERGIWT